ncbi:hypothetical protein OIDMADRAFT_135039 [Oidiodendron maius Zn]|uniref:tRNA (adenine(58)-N(1))-methyltransferase catalytic subunit TRM61 n=1 Tax=Oidiodendron maius (strain Zn) TaxID=913774 RepID=A0A0C3GY60_OIDMZ|nr:hypothetical protein OIDMADRAFT_135039 [Oidiodendron maius Zn]
MNDIIGKKQRDWVTSMKGQKYMLQDPTLAEYTSCSERVVTPIYPQDASLIVSLLDLHPSTPDTEDRTKEERLEIFEAGTGHGSLTLHLARAIHGANTHAPNIPSSATTSEDEEGDAYGVWRANRRALISSIDASAAHSSHAQMVVRNFRRGMYYPHVDFHVGEIVDFLSSRLASNKDEPFLTHAILDLPDPSLYLEILSKALNPFGKLVTFSPSVTQTLNSFQAVKEQRLPLILEKVLEVGAGFGSGGREWDLRSVLPKSRQQNVKQIERHSTNVSGDTMLNDEETETSQTNSESEPDVEPWQDTSQEDLETVCRPKPGVRIEGGGFIGLWRRMHF